MKVIGYINLLVNHCSGVPGDTFLLTNGARVREGELDFFLTTEELIIGAGREPAQHSRNQASLSEKAYSENMARHFQKDLSKVENFHGKCRVVMV